MVVGCNRLYVSVNGFIGNTWYRTQRSVYLSLGAFRLVRLQLVVRSDYSSFFIDAHSLHEHWKPIDPLQKTCVLVCERSGIVIVVGGHQIVRVRAVMFRHVIQ
jgi:hypothetical protein